MNQVMTHAHRAPGSRWETTLISFLFCFTICSTQLWSQGSSCANALPVVVHFNAGTRTANGPSTGNGAVNTCYSTGGATHADWYQYTPKFNGHIKISSCGGGYDTRLSVFTGSCGNLVCYAYSDDACPMVSGGPAWASNLENLAVTARTTYYIQWDNRWSSAEFDWYLYEYPDSPSNELFCSAPTLNCGSNVFGTTEGANTFTTESCGFDMGYDVYYKIDAFAGIEYTVTLDVESSASVMSAGVISDLSDCYGSDYDIIACDALQPFPNGIRTLTFTRTTDEAVFIRVSETSYNGEPGFNIGLTCSLPANDECVNATNIPVNGPPVMGNNATATVSNNLPVNCGNAGDTDTDADVWFKFTAPYGGQIFIETYNNPSVKGIFDTQIQVFKTCGGPSLFCDEDGGIGYMSTIVIPCDDYIKNAVYYIQVDGWNSSRGSFSISVTTAPCPPPPNDICSSATPLSLNTTGNCDGNQTMGTTMGAESSSPWINACEISSPDVYYMFNSEDNNEVIINLNAVTATDLVLSGFQGSCNSEAFFCSIGTNQSVQKSVVPYTDYYIRVHSYSAQSAGSFNICVEKVVPPLATINGSITGWNSNCGSRSMVATLLNSSLLTTYEVNTTLNQNGTFQINTIDIPAGTYNILITVQGTLAILSENVVLTGGTNSFSTGPLTRGDINNNNVVNILDLSAFSVSFGKTSGSAGYNFLADLNCDGVINIFDLSILSTGFNKTGDNLSIVAKP